MSNLSNLFQSKQNNVLNVYCTAGYPQLNSTISVMQSLADAGADIIEIGIPFSDPLADGPVIQASSSIALQNGMNIEILFNQLKNFRQYSSLKNTSIVLMGYLNSVLQFGFEKFCATAATVGIDGLILPDLPEHEFELNYGSIIKKYNLDFIFLVTPETPEQRVKKLDSLSSGFLYAVSSSATTGYSTTFDKVEQYLQKLQSYQLNNKILVGFGIKDKATFQTACKYANGAIIGSAYISALHECENISATTKKFLSAIL